MEENDLTQENNLSPEEKKRLLDIRKKRFGNMNIPTPVAPIAPGAVVNVKDPKMLSRIQEIRTGKLKQEFKAFDSKGGANAGHQDVPLPTKKQPGRPNPNSNPNKTTPPPLSEFSAKPDPFLDGIKNIFSDSPSSSSSYGQPVQYDDGGSSFSKEFTNKFRNRLNEKAQQVLPNQQQFTEDYNPGVYQAPILQSGMIVLNEEDLKKKIIEVAKPLARQVATEVIKQVLNEYLKKPEKPVVTESPKTNTVKTEVLSDGRVKINGKIYKISPDK